MEFIDIIIANISIWFPSVIAVLGTICSLIAGAKRIGDYVKLLHEEEGIKEVKEELQVLLKQNKELVKTNKMLIDEIKRIEGYCDSIQEE